MGRSRLPGENGDGGTENTQGGTKVRYYYYSNRCQGLEEELGPPVQGGEERVSWEGRGGFRLGFSHSLLSPQAWSFSGVSWVGAALGLSGLRGRYVWHAPRGLVPTAGEGRGSSQALHPISTCSGQGYCQGKCPKEQGPAWSRGGLALVPHGRVSR